MKRVNLLALAGVVVMATPALAQDPAPHPGQQMRLRVEAPMRMAMTMAGDHGAMMGGNQADFLLGHTGELNLTDQQVVRLAAIARRAHEREQTMHRGMMAQHMGADMAPPNAAAMERMRASMEQMHTAMRADLRDALAVLTPDQQATAWEMAARGHGGPEGMGGNRVFVRRIQRDGPAGAMMHHDEDDDDEVVVTAPPAN
jgi:hypothetical protein